ncbi:MAG TPA: iron-containing alcohol dehydrogenase [Patescibacteria group bacterium]|nr:iron-containing alcohol dehydrogenase [Patescibacteria group bacterium]
MTDDRQARALVDMARATSGEIRSATLGATRVLFGPGAVAELGAVARTLGAGRALVVTDAGLRAAGHLDRVLAALDDASLSPVVFDGVKENPTTADVERGVSAAKGRGIDLIVGLGGGSAMDCAKGINFILTNGGRMEDYRGTNLARQPMLPSIGIPTTAGTGSEAQAFALIEQEGTRVKMACGDDKARFRAAILDPDLTATTPRRVAATAGLDAVSHAVESYVTTRRNPLSQLFAREAWGLLSTSYAESLDHMDNGGARGRMLLGAFLAGAAIDASMLGAAHACANPLTSRYGIAHGAAVMLMLPHVVRFNAPMTADLYDDLAESGSLAARLEAMRRIGGLPERLSDAGVPYGDLAGLADEASAQWTASFNPRPVTRDDILGFYETAY